MRPLLAQHPQFRRGIARGALSLASNSSLLDLLGCVLVLLPLLSARVWRECVSVRGPRLGSVYVAAACPSLTLTLPLPLPLPPLLVGSISRCEYLWNVMITRLVLMISTQVNQLNQLG